MYAVIRTGGKQYRVREGDRLRVEKLDAEPGAEVELSDVLMVGEGSEVTVGRPLVDAGVTATVRAHGRGEKVKVVKFRRRKHYLRRRGHRQDFTEIEIVRIGGAGTGSGGAAAQES